MVRHHVPERAGRLVEGAAQLDADRLGRGDLHVLDVPPVPDRLVDAVPEAQGQDVLDRLLPEEVVDPVDLLLRHHLQDPAVERLRGGKVGAEGLLDDHPPETAPGVGVVAGRPQAVDDRPEKTCRHRQIEDDVALPLPAAGLEQGGELRIAPRIVKIRREVTQPLLHPAPGLPVEGADVKFTGRVAGEGAHGRGQAGPPLRGRLGHVVHAEEAGPRIEQAAPREIVEGGHQEPLDQVPAAPEENDRAGGSRLRARGGRRFAFGSLHRAHKVG